MVAPCVISSDLPTPMAVHPDTFRVYRRLYAKCDPRTQGFRPAPPGRSKAVLGPGDGLAGGRRGEREGRVVVGEVDVPAGVAGLQELGGGGERDVRAARRLGVLELQRGLPE